MAMYMNKPKLKDIINNMYDVADVENLLAEAVSFDRFFL